MATDQVGAMINNTMTAALVATQHITTAIHTTSSRVGMIRRATTTVSEIDRTSTEIKDGMIRSLANSMLGNLRHGPVNITEIRKDQRARLVARTITLLIDMM